MPRSWTTPRSAAGRMARMSFLSNARDVPRSLRIWFVIHFVADLVFAVPLIVAPRWLGGVVAYPSIDPLTARLVGAALVGIGVESLLGRNASRDSFRTMLRLKVLWSSTACVGLGLTVVETQALVAWAVLGVFGAFCALWTRYLVVLSRTAAT